MKSMTGFGFAEAQSARWALTVEIKSYNNRYLDLMLTLPPALNPLEERMREVIRGSVARGRIECHVRFRDLEESLEITLDKANVAAYVDVLSQLRQVAGIKEELGIAHLLSMEGLVRIDRQRDPELYWQALHPVLQEALSGLVQSRSREGSSVRVDLLVQLQRVRNAVGLITQRAPDMEAQVKDNLRKRFADLLGDKIEEQRILAEVAVQMNRLTINEELVRLAAHLQTTLELIQGSEASGKKLDFLCQEMNREINTIGSKNILLDISNAVIDVKDALENIREQIRNVE